MPTALSPAPSSLPLAWPARRLGPDAALWLAVSVLMMFLAASSAPSPLYAIYREMWGFSAFSLTVVFSSYAFALLAALLWLRSAIGPRGGAMWSSRRWRWSSSR